MFARHAFGRTVAATWADPTIMRNASPGELDAALRGQRFDEPTRHGKWLVCLTDGPVLLLHFGMTGDLLWADDGSERHRHDRLALTLVGGGEIRYRNMRKFGGVWLARDRADAAALLGRVGPDALALDRRMFGERVGGRRRAVKAVLMDQSILAGVGNLMADEILWRARIDPRRPVASLTEDEIARLHRVMRRVLADSVARYDYLPARGTWFLSVRGRPGAHCPRCRTPLERSVVGGRTTWSCPSCQR